jgi:hypothetical protein
MAIRVECPSCGKVLEAPEEYAGRNAVCPSCRNPLSLTEAVAQQSHISVPTVHRRFVSIKKVVASVATVVVASLIGYSVGRTRSDDETLQQLRDVEEQLQYQLDLAKYHEQDEKDWAAADVEFLDRHTYFHSDAKAIIEGIQQRYTTDTPYYAGSVSRVKTALGAWLEFGTSDKGVTSATIKFPESKRDHGLDIVRMVAARLVGAATATGDVVQFASYRTTEPGVLMLRFGTRGVVGVSTRDEGNYRSITVHFTPTGTP